MPILYIKLHILKNLYIFDNKSTNHTFFCLFLAMVGCSAGKKCATLRSDKK
jgi:hypothetical protein